MTLPQRSFRIMGIAARAKCVAAGTFLSAGKLS
ncbi:MAG: hypothetical protein ACJARC_000239 [Sulfitobacter sp.]|jgi:hypothetical protein